MEVGLADPLLVAESLFAAKEDFGRVVVHRQQRLADSAEDVLWAAGKRLAKARGMTTSRLAAERPATAIAALITGTATLVREIPAAIRAVSSL